MTQSGIGDFATERLGVRFWGSALADGRKRRALEAALTSWLRSPVLAELPVSMQLTDEPDAIVRWVNARAIESDVHLVEPGEGGEPFGLLILARPPGDPSVRTIHIGFLLAERVWGRGYATELLRGLVAAARLLAPVRLRGGVSKDNPASAHALQKAGFRHFATEGETDIFVLDLG